MLLIVRFYATSTQKINKHGIFNFTEISSIPGGDSKEDYSGKLEMSEDSRCVTLVVQRLYMNTDTICNIICRFVILKITKLQRILQIL